jgi:hypothetical protein
VSEHGEWKTTTVSEINRRVAEDDDFERRLVRLDRRAKRRHDDEVSDEFMRRAQRAATKDYDSMLGGIITDWPYAKPVPYAERVRLMSVALTSGSKRSLVVLHRWHVERCKDDGMPVCAMEEPKSKKRKRSTDSFPTLASPLYLAISRGNSGIIATLHELHTTCCNPTRHNTKLAKLLLALMTRRDEAKNAEILRAITSRWTHANAICDEDKCHTVLFRAVENSPEHIRRLIAVGCDVEWRDAAGLTPLQYAVTIRNEIAAETLLNCGAEPNSKVMDGTGRRTADLLPGDGMDRIRARIALCCACK